MNKFTAYNLHCAVQKLKSAVHCQSGQVFILITVVLAVVMLTTVAIIGGALTFSQSSKYSTETVQATNLAEAGIDKAVASLNKTGGSYNGENEVNLGEGSYTVEITSVDSSTKLIKATGYVPNKANPKSKKTVTMKVSKGVGVAFNYGVQVGEGGFEMSNSATINGSVYTNGNIIMNNNARINGDAYVAGGIQPTANQENDCGTPNCLDYSFGQTSQVMDVAQSFQLTTTTTLNKVALKLKKFGSPTGTPTVRILGSSGCPSNCVPNKNNIIASGNLNSSLISSSSYNFVDVTFSTNPTLNGNTVYWVMIDISTSNNSNYWQWSSDSTQGYTRGSAKFSANWQASSPVWNNISPSGDLGFKAYVGGVATGIFGTNSPIITGDAHANTIQNIIIQKDAYYQVESGNTVSGANCSSNSHCHPNSEDPPAIPMPISDANITDWKAEAVAANPNLPSPDCNDNTVWGPGKYNGSVSMSNTCREKVKTPIWITGNLSLANNSEMKLDPTLGATSGVVIVSNFIDLNNSGKLLGSGTPGSYLIALSEFNSRDDPSHRDAVIVSNSGNQGVVYSNLGSINISNSNTMTEITAWKLKLSNNVVINYDQGMASAFFNSGPSGQYSAIKGTYQVK